MTARDELDQGHRSPAPHLSLARTLITCANRTVQALAIFLPTLWLLGALVAWVEGWSVWRDSWYFAMVTGSTTGYGDLSPATVPGRLITALLIIPIGLIGVGVIVGRVAATVIETRDAWKDEEQEQVKGDLKEIRVLLTQLVERSRRTPKMTATVVNNPQSSRVLDALRRVPRPAATVRATGGSMPRHRPAEDQLLGLLNGGGSYAMGGVLPSPLYDPSPAASDGGVCAPDPSPSTSSYDGGTVDSSSYDGGSSYDSGSSSGGGSDSGC